MVRFTVDFMRDWLSHSWSLSELQRIDNMLLFSPNAALADDGKFLLAAHKCRRPTFTDYLISLDAGNMSKGSSAYVGKLRCHMNSM